jgi:polyphenol oxidase
MRGTSVASSPIDTIVMTLPGVSEPESRPGALPEPTGAFVWRQAPWGYVLECVALAPFARHAFTARDLSPGSGVAEDQAWAALASHLGVASSSLSRLNQVHGCRTVAIDTDAARTRSTGLADADALASNRPDVALAVKAADCVPILLADRRGRGVAAVHAGWRGTAQAIVARAVETLRERYQIEPASIVAAIGPSIGACCYEVGPDVRAGFETMGIDGASLERWFTPGAGDRLQLDLWRANREQLEDGGVPAESIHIARLCTACHVSCFFSYRREGTRAGRMIAAIRMQEAGA